MLIEGELPDSNPRDAFVRHQKIDAGIRIDRYRRMRNYLGRKHREEMRNQSEVTSTLQGFPALPTSLRAFQLSYRATTRPNFIGKVLENLVDQYESDRYEIIVVDGRSEDRTRDEIEAFKSTRPELSVVLVYQSCSEHSRGPQSGNCGSAWKIIARMDAHAVPSDGYVRRCVEVLRQDQAGVVGMPAGCDRARIRVDGAGYRCRSFSSFWNRRCEVSAW